MNKALGNNLRPITFSITGGALTYEAIEVATAKVREIENLYSVNPNAVTDLTDASVVLTGKTPFKVFAFTVTTVKATGAYEFTLESIAPTIEQLSF